jgi:hypothetical protein
MAIPPDPLDCARPPVYGDRLPIVMGSGGWPIEEPSIQQVDHFLRCVGNAIKATRYEDENHFGGKDGDSLENTLYHDVIKVRQWLQFLVDQKLLFDDVKRHG